MIRFLFGLITGAAAGYLLTSVIAQRTDAAVAQSGAPGES